MGVFWGCSDLLLCSLYFLLFNSCSCTNLQLKDLEKGIVCRASVYVVKEF